MSIKRILSGLMALVLTLGCIPVTVLATEVPVVLAEETAAAEAFIVQTDETAETVAATEGITNEAAMASEIHWDYDAATGTLTFSGTGTFRSPLGSAWLDYLDQAKSIVFQEGFQEINLDGCYKLETLYLPASMTDLSFWGGNYACLYILYAGTAGQWANVSGRDCVDEDFAVIFSGNTGNLGSSLTWRFSESTGTLTIQGNGKMPDASSDYTLKRPWGIFSEQITKVVLEEGITAVGKFAFQNHRALKEVLLPESLTSMGYRAFMNCSSLTSITLPASLTEFGMPFEGCTSLKDIYFNGSVGQWDKMMWYNWKEDFQSYNLHIAKLEGTLKDGFTWSIDEASKTLTILCDETGNGELTNGDYPWERYTDRYTKLVLGEGVTAVGGYAFRNQTNLTQVTLSEGVQSIGYNAFEGCTNLQSVTLPEGLTSIFIDAFKGCTNLKSITLPNTLTGMGSSAFENCSSLETVVIPTSLPRISDYLFRNCTSLKSVTIPVSVTDIEASAFSGCTALTDIYFGSTLAVWEKITSGTLPEGVTIHTVTGGTCGEALTWNLEESTGVLTIQGTGKMTDYYADTAPWAEYADKIQRVVVGEGVTHIGNFAFGNGRAIYATTYPAIVSISLPSTLTSIGEGAFTTCTSLKALALPNALTSIGENAFRSCSALTELVIPDSVTTIEPDAFSKCTSLVSATLSAGMSIIPEGIFQDCSALQTVTIPGGVTEIGFHAFYDCKMLNNVTLPKGLTTIGSGAFYGCAALEAIQLPQTIISIEASAFQLCKSLTQIELPQGLTTLSKSSFSSSGLTSITIPDSVTTIEGYAFWMAPLASVTIPDSVTSIGPCAFSNTALTSVKLPEGLTEISESCFSSCKALAEVILPSSVTSIGSNAFENCTALSQIDLPEGLEIIHTAAFWYCTGLQSVEIPSSVTQLYAGAFANCTGLQNIYFLGDPPAVLGAYLNAVPADGNHYFSYPFEDVVASAFYFLDNTNWKNIDLMQYGPDLTWNGYIHAVFPDLTLTKGTGRSMKLTWSAVDGATAYEVWCAAGEAGTFSLLGTVSSSSNGTVQFTHSDATPGTICQYKVRAIFGENGVSNFSDTVSGRSALSQPQITVANDAASGKPVLTWKAVNGAVKYQVYRSKTGKTGSFGLINTVKTLTTTNNSAVAGTKYYYKVRAVTEEGTKSDYSNVVSITCDLPRPTGVKTSNDASTGKNKISWNKVEGAVKYQVWHSTTGKAGSFKLLMTTKNLSHVHKASVAGKMHYYKVKAIHSNADANSALTGWFNRTCDLAQPTGVKITAGANGKNQITWNAVPGAAKYQVWYSKTGKVNTFTCLMTTKNLNHTHKGGVAGQRYYYKIKAIHTNTNANSAWSAVVNRISK